MIIKPVQYVPTPGYPDKYGAQTRVMLATARPRRWTGKNVAVGLMSATIALGLTGCALENPSIGFSTLAAASETVKPDDYEYTIETMLLLLSGFW